MPKYTDKFKLGYFEAGDTSDAIVESNRWRTIDAQMQGLFAVLGNGVISGWDFVVDDEDALSISITPGTGHINSVSVESVSTVTLVLTESSRNYIYARSSNDSYYNKTVSFEARIAQTSSSSYLLLGYVDTASLSDNPVITDTNIDDRVYVSFQQQILNLIKDHRHIGGTLNPSKINLATDVQGFLRDDNIEDLDASFVGSGQLSQDVIPSIDHLTKLTNVGTLTHAQLDTFVQIMGSDGVRLMGETSSVDLLKMILAVKHVYPQIDDYLVNELAFIPGISPATIVDTVNTTAEVDYRPASEGGQHTITGVPVDSTTTFTKKWDSNSEFLEAALENTVAVGDSIRIATKENRVYVDDFQDVTDWEAVTTNMSSVSASFSIDSILSGNSGKVVVENDDAEIVFILKKTFSAQDWKKYNKISFKFYCDSAKHGDIYFYLYDSISGSQGSYTLILDRNVATINQDTLAVGWREIVVDISNYTRENITSVGFYTSTSSGWSIDDSFSYYIDDMYLTSGNFFLDRGTAIFSYGNGYNYNFSAVRWDASVPDDTYVKIRTRVSNESDMEDSLWSDFITVSGGSIELPSANVYQYIDIELTLESNYDGNSDLTPQLYALYLDCTVASLDKSFSFNTKDSWDSGTLRNIDTETSLGKIKIKNITDLGTYVYSTSGSLKQLNTSMEEILSIYGANIPKSFAQMLSGESAGFGQISSIVAGLRDSFIVSDTDNDRVLEIDKSGEVLWGLMGAFHETPQNPSIEPQVVASESASETAVPFNCLGAYYNIEDSKLSIMFDDDIENIYTSTSFAPERMFLKAGTRRIYFDKSKFSFNLFGLDESFYGKENIGRNYLSGSNVLLVSFSEADAVTISGVAASSDPYIVTVSPKINEVISQDSLTAQFVVYNCSLGQEDFGIRVSLDGEASQDIRAVSEIEYSSLDDGLHALQINLIDSNGNILATEGTECTLYFYVSTGTFSESAISIISVSDNQVVSSGSLSVSFLTYNVPLGYNLRYILDTDTWVEHSGSDPIELTGLAGGEHTLRLYLSNDDNDVLAGLMTDISVTFVVGSRSNVSFTLSVGKDSVKSASGTGVSEVSAPVYVTPIRIANIYSPVDANLVLSDSVEGSASEFNVLIAKMATPSYLNYYEQSYADGHSVVEYSSSGTLVLSDNSAIIADTKENAKKFFGGASKYGGNELFIADAYGQKAIVVELDTNLKKSSTVWCYESDKMISDFNRVPNASDTNFVNDSGIVTSSLYSRRETTVTWYNNTNDTIRIVSGVTDYDQFYADPDFDLFGSEFDSGDILPGEYYSFEFLNLGTYDYFVYPFIYTGKIYVIETSISPSDTFIVVENDQNESSYLNRILKIDAWGNVQWSFGESFVSLIKDAKPVSSTEVIIAV